MNFFCESDGKTISWRKLLTFEGALLFATAILGFLFWGLPELPPSYQIIISGIFGFYFIKDALRKIGGTK